MVHSLFDMFTSSLPSTCVINVCDGLSYDTALRRQTIFDRHVIIASVHTLLETFSDTLSLSLFSHQVKTESELESRNTDKHTCENIMETIKRIGYSKITLNFECCSDYGFGSNHYFVDKTISGQVIRIIAHMLKYGSQVICSDFAAKALISNWDQNIFESKCPFTIIGSTHGSVCVKYLIDECKNCPFPQLAALSSVALPDSSEHTHTSMISSCTMDALANTLVYGISTDYNKDHDKDQSLDLKVYSIATHRISKKLSTKLDLLFPNELAPPTLVSSKELGSNQGLKSDTYDYESLNILNQISREKEKEYYTKIINDSTKEVLMEGLPVHTVVLFKHFIGSLVISSLHLSNLTDVNTSFEKVIDSATLYLGPQRSYELEELLRQTTLEKPELVRSVTSSIVSEITASAVDNKFID